MVGVCKFKFKVQVCSFGPHSVLAFRGVVTTNKTVSVRKLSIGTRSSNYCSRGRAISVTYSKCVFVNLVIQHAK